MAERKLQSLIRSTLQRAMPLLPHDVLLKIRQAPLVGNVLQRLVNRSMGSPGVQEVEISGGALKGKRMLLNLATHKNYWLGAYELGVEENLRRIVQPNYVAYDIGTHFGYFTLFLGDLCGAGGKVFAFEADPDNFERLQANLALNRCDNIQGFHRAIAAESGSLSFLRTPASEMGRIIEHRSVESKEASASWIENLKPDKALDLFRREQSLCQMELEMHSHSPGDFEQAKTLSLAADKKAATGTFAAALADLKEARRLIGRQVSGAESVVQVPAITLDEFVFGDPNRKPDFLKIDVEGAEDVVLEGARRTLEVYRPTLLCEVHSTEVGYSVWSILNDVGYRLFDMSDGWKPIADSYMPVPLGGLHIVAGHHSLLQAPPFVA